MDVRVTNYMTRDFNIGVKPAEREVNGKVMLIPTPGGSRLRIPAGGSTVCDKDVVEAAISGNLALQAYLDTKKIGIMPVLSSETVDVDTEESVKLEKPDELKNTSKGKAEHEVKGIETAIIPDAPKGGKKAGPKVAPAPKK